MGLDVSRIRGLCFDVDGTLSDTDDVWVQQFEERLRWMRFLFRKGEVRPAARWLVMTLETPGNVGYHVLDRLNLDAWMIRGMQRLGRLRARRRKTFRMVPQVLEMLTAVRGRLPMSVVSARDEESTLAFLHQFDLRGLFHSVATSQTCQYTKPFPDPVVWAARQMGLEPQECLMIGDTTVDIRAGKAAGAQTVGVLCGFGDEKELRRAGADLILPSTADLAQVLFGEHGG